MNQGYAQQKRITGRQKTYVWQNPKTSPAHARRESGTASVSGAKPCASSRREMRQQKKKYEELLNLLASYLLLICVVFGVFMVIGKLSQIAAQNTRNENLGKEISALIEAREDKQDEFELESRADIIEHRAKYELGMSYPDYNEVAYLRTFKRNTNAAVQTAEGSVGSR